MYKQLSETEMLIMKELWKIGRPISVKELAEWFSTVQGIEWKVQTISTFLTRMERKKFVESVKRGKAKFYYPAITEDEIKSIEARGLLENYYEGSFKKFLVALSSGRISSQEAEALEQWLNEQKEGKS
ncbi:BlaI/MecI/CopY family transcriptional regulator [Enterocloster bolteae]|uniref:BlaI/MecI/CopY family transcriptional regulator n=1 Tax=Enterocloster bolteae TaxID=208479 RepID=UPI0028DB86A4|nr:BlaI/MecI/CopY family transcriptional regulator [Enterocloster bolteae]